MWELEPRWRTIGYRGREAGRSLMRLRTRRKLQRGRQGAGEGTTRSKGRVRARSHRTRQALLSSLDSILSARCGLKECHNMVCCPLSLGCQSSPARITWLRLDCDQGPDLVILSLEGSPPHHTAFHVDNRK